MRHAPVTVLHCWIRSMTSRSINSVKRLRGSAQGTRGGRAEAAEIGDQPAGNDERCAAVDVPKRRLLDVTEVGVVANAAWSGLPNGPLLLRDTMTLTQWQPPPARPARCVVDHTGTLVRGAGAFEVDHVSADRSRVVWSEWIQLPFGLLGELGWVVVRPVVAFFLTASLRRLARVVETQRAPGS